jgi:hypothetical protein
MPSGGSAKTAVESGASILVDAAGNKYFKRLLLPLSSMGAGLTLGGGVELSCGLCLPGTGVCLYAPNGPRFKISLTVENFEGDWLEDPSAEGV